jgi:mono/diheme cytochrome c family protein
VGTLYTFLRTGLSPDHSAAAGPMAPVVDSLSSVPEADVRAIATYIASKMAGRSVPDLVVIYRQEDAARKFPVGATLFAGACAECHGTGAPMTTQGRPSLALASDLTDSDPTNAIQAVLLGINPPIAGRGPKMPPFSDILTDAQVAETLAYARARFTDRTGWPRLERAVVKARKESQP